MQMVGRPNPLAQFLAGRTIAVGEKIELPSAVASQIFNLGDKFGKVSRFTLTLKKVQTEGGVTLRRVPSQCRSGRQRCHANAARSRRAAGRRCRNLPSSENQPGRTNRHVRNARQLQHSLPGDRHRQTADEHRVYLSRCKAITAACCHRYLAFGSRRRECISICRIRIRSA